MFTEVCGRVRDLVQGGAEKLTLFVSFFNKLMQKAKLCDIIILKSGGKKLLRLILRNNSKTDS